ncbi:GNAT family N-acetyltransferase [Pseudonocardia acaciae]|uniref:GNAT family N-acetyltransferase n=1 Tax=Pseudonocardia acaciae TaxID=551276 RepID=UPI000491CC66|nr:GNAT family N-acetyltransferase [Pseudonocardia acaciae]
MELRVVGYDHPDVVKLVDAVQEEYVRRYGGPDSAPIAASQFAPPSGIFLVGYLDGRPVACGGWRRREADGESGLRDGDVEIKRMFVVSEARGRGYSRLVLGELERTAAAAGGLRMVLETGTGQPEALGLYTSSGYLPIAKFGEYRCSPRSRHLGKPLA